MIEADLIASAGELFFVAIEFVGDALFSSPENPDTAAPATYARPPMFYNILAISGSLRAQSSNTETLLAAARLAPPGVQVLLYAGLATLPQFNPDLDTEDSVHPENVTELREKIAAADALLICSPEYAHGVPGALKNALDWLVSGSEIPFKPIGLINISPRSTYAQEQLAETLRTMSTVLVPGASIVLPLSGRDLDATAIAADTELSALIRAALKELVAAVPEYRRKRKAL